ncbi:MAG: hypothetical protein IPP77_10420 [Bacteroidetes bacterium]|nr:hypothetical protein [Bacteroidota bacterium]
MKIYSSLLTVLLSVFFFNQSNATVWRVNNSGFNAPYSTIALALSAVTTLPGDTIHVEPSQTAYATTTVTKRVVIIGNGYYLSGVGSNIGKQANTYTSSVVSLNMNAGSFGSVVMGMTISSLAIREKNITFQRNNITGIATLYLGADSCNFFQNSVTGISYSGTVNANRILIANNFFSVGGSSYGINLPSTVYPIIENNTFVSNSYITTYNAQINNNILVGGVVTLNNSVAFNNVCGQTQFPAGNGNLQNVTSINLFVSTGSSDGYYFLKTGSPAIGAGYNGVDCGMTGGNLPYRLSGIPEIPTIYDLTVPAIGTGTLNVTISTRSND